jgi:glycosyltransferase involved in cell wall biosynthesis
MKNILYISPSLQVKGGISSVLKGYLHSDLTKKYNIKIVASHVDGPKTLKFLRAITAFIHTFILLLFKQVDLVHIHAGDTISFKRKYFFIKLVKIFRCKVIYHNHGAEFMKQYQFLSNSWKKRVMDTLESVNLVICLSDNWRAKFHEISQDANIIVVPNGIAIPRNIQKIETENVRLVFLGLIGKRKGVFDLLKVVKKLKQKDYPIKLMIGGTGDIEKLLFDIEALHLSDHVNYLGWIREKDRDLLLRETDIFILPSYAEGMPMAILEAMAYSLPVISTSVGGIPSLVTNGQTGYLINPGDLDDMYKKISYLIKNRNLRKLFGETGKNYVHKNHNIKIITEKIDYIYSNL